MGFFPLKIYLPFILTTLLSILLIFILYYQMTTQNYSKPPKIIWTYWNDDNIPPIVKKIMDHRASVLKSWRQIVLSDATLGDYVDPPDEYYKLGQTHKSDWLRLALLKKYGGCWMDATIIVNSESALNKMYNESVRKQSEFTGFFTPLCIINNDPSSFIESWFIMAPKGSRVITAWYAEYLKACKLGFLEYKRDSLKKHIFSPHIYNPSNDDVYLTVYAACQMAIQKRLSRKANIMLYNSYDSMYKLHYQCWDEAKNDYDHECIVKRLATDHSVKKISFIKITGHTRKFMEKVDISAYFD